jgi:hypothetical protein
MPVLQHSLLFSKYTFDAGEIAALQSMLADPLLKALIRHIVADEVQTHILTPMTSIGDCEILKDSEMFVKGVIQIGTLLLNTSNLVENLKESPDVDL